MKDAVFRLPGGFQAIGGTSMDIQTVIALCAIFTVVIEIVRLTDGEK